MPPAALSFHFRYGIAFVSILLATWVRLLLNPLLGIQFPFATFFFAVLLTAYYGGLFPALLAVVLGALSANYFIMSPQGKLNLEGLDQQVGMLLFLGTGIGVAWLGGTMHDAFESARRSEAAVQEVVGTLEARIHERTEEIIRTNELLRSSEAKFRAYIENAPAAVLVADCQGRFVDVNAAAAHMLGYDVRQLLGMSVPDIHPEEDREQIRHDFLRLVQEGHVEGEYRLLRQDGRWIWGDLRVVLLDGQSLGYCVDVTESKRVADALRESEERLRLFIEHAPVALAMFDRQMRYLAASHRWLTDYNLGDQAILHRSHYDIFPEIPDSWKAVHQRALAGEVVRAEEDRLVRSDGRVQWLRWEVRPWVRTDGSVGGIVIFTEEITARKQAEEALILFRVLLDHTKDAIRVIDPESGRFLDSNESGWTCLGYTREELLALTVPDLDPIVAAEGWAHRLGKHRACGESVFETLHQRKDGTTFAVEMGLRLVRLNREYLITVCRDITERKRTEQALSNREEQIRNLLNSTAEAIYGIDSGGYCTFCNPACLRLLGYERAEDLLGKNMHNTIHHTHPDGTTYRDTECPLICAFRDGIGQHTEAEFFWRADGTSFPVEAWCHPIHSAGAVTGAVVTFLDITQRKRDQEALQRANADLLRSVRQLAAVNRELSARTQETEAFVYSVSHDLRSPLVNLQGFSRELERSVQELRPLLQRAEGAVVDDRLVAILDGPMAKSIRFIQTAVSRLSNIIDGLLKLSRAGRVTYQQQPVDVRTVVQRVIDSLRSTTESRGASIEVNELPVALSDASAVERIFANLIGNALNYLDAKRPGRIVVGCLADSAGGQRAYFVRDNGLGITEAGKAKLFHPFQRLHPQVSPGEGMGLAIVQRVVERLGGRIWFDSTAGQGTTFFVALPATPENDSAAGPLRPPPRERSERP